ncbi:MAG: hypothetical protein KHZ29_07080, partial [Desulfovibrionaceae bacterium]|nr:hypothetical protein [Desulfovibrionaceae bacterium]
AQYRALLVSPLSMRDCLLDLIEREIVLHERQGGGEIILKCNQLVDKAIIRALYRASASGVRVRLQIRGICCLRPGLKGLSDAIEVTSVVGRFLEHSRAFWFRNGGDPCLYIGSADLMPRNLDRRVEVLTPILDPGLRNLIHGILETHLADNVQAWKLKADGTYVRLRPGRNPAVDSQALMAARPDLLTPPDNDGASASAPNSGSSDTGAHA